VSSASFIAELLLGCERAFAELGADLSSAGAPVGLLEELGWDVPEGTDLTQVRAKFAALSSALVSFGDAARTLAALPEETTLESYAPVVESVATAVANTVTAVQALTQVQPGSLPGPFANQALWTSLAGDAVDLLIIRYLDRNQRIVSGVLRTIGVIVEEEQQAGSGRNAYVRKTMNWDALGQLFSDPGNLMAEVYGWGGTFKADLLLRNLCALFSGFGLAPARLKPPTPLVDLYYAPTHPARAQLTQISLPLYWEPLATDPGSEVLAVDLQLGLLPIPPAGNPAGAPSGLLLFPSLESAASVAFPVTESTTLTIAGALQAALVRLEVYPDSANINVLPVAAQFSGSVRLEGEPETPWILLGTKNSSRLEMDGAHIELGLVGSGTDQEVSIEAGLNGARVVIQLDESDGFLSSVLGTEPQVIPFSLAAMWSNKSGFRFSGQVELQLTLPINLSIAGICTINTLHITLGASQTGAARVALAVDTSLKLGPLSATVERMGMALDVVPKSAPQAPGNLGPLDVRFGFSPPSGIGLSIVSGPVNGGGYLFCDPDKGQYAGALQLGIKAINLSAIGLLSTKLPSGQPGFSLLVIIAAEFPSIPLPFGFALNGVGGLVGIHRRMDTDALKLKVSEGVLGSILFPQDPVGRIQTVLSDLRTVFPIQEGRHVFGPMVKLTWGPGALLRMELAIILDIPSPLRLVILGRIRLVLPTETDAIADIKLEVAGFIDFDRQEASIAAALVDSRLAGFTLTGDMAMFLGWGATKSFAVSMGGFFPGFTPPPGMPPRMRRLALGLTSGDNPRLTLETYFAVTSNTVQFGARAELYAATDTFAGTFAAMGMASFDALIQFEPFGFLAQLRALLCILRNGSPILSAELQANLSGPKPWHAEGFVEFQIVVKVRVPFEVTVGEPEQIPPPVVNLFDLLLTEVRRKESWASTPAPEAGAIATLRDSDPADGIVLHPLSSVTLLQRQMPFEKVLNRFGAARPDGSAPRFTLERIGVGSSGSAPTTAFADFAPGQFDDLTEDEKISRPAFEAMPAGGAAVLAAFKAPAARTTAAGAAGQANWADGFQDIVLEGTTRSASGVSAGFGLAFPQDGPVERALRAQSTGIQIASESYALADVDTLEVPNFAAYAGSRAQAEDLWKALGPADRVRYTVVPSADTWINP